MARSQKRILGAPLGASFFSFALDSKWGTGCPEARSPFPTLQDQLQELVPDLFHHLRVPCRAVRVRKEERSPTEAAPPLTAKEHACRR